MTEPRIIDIGVSKLSNSPVMGPKLSVISNNDNGAIKLNHLPSLSSPHPTKSVNFGPGVEMLMNPGKVSRVNSPKSDIHLSELKSLETNDFSKKRSRDIRAEVLNSIPYSNDTIKLNISEPKIINNPPVHLNASHLGNATSQTIKKEETWDGFQKFNEIPVDATKRVPETPKLTPEEELKEKFIFIRKLEALDKKGIQVSKKYNMDDKLDVMKGEYETIKSEQQKRNSVKFQGKMLMAFVSGIEFLNDRFDPFDIKLDGWGEAVSENLEEYDDVFAELHEKYGGKAKVAPELKLLFMLGGSAGMIHITNSMFKSAVPGMDDIMRQNPGLAQQFTQAAVNTMGQQNPGFGNFMQNMMPPRGSPPGPPIPMNQSYNRPDLNMARGRANFKDAVNMEDQYSNISKQKSNRKEMKGPSDINDILLGVKTKKVNIKTSDNSSTISISELKEMKDTLPKKSKRKPRSARNTVSLNI